MSVTCNPPRYPAELIGSIVGALDLGARHYAIPNGFGGYLWWHDCTAVEHVSWDWFGQGAEEASGHRIIARTPLTVAGSLICTDCGDHGFIRGARWVPV